MRAQLGELHGCIDWLAILDYVEIVGRKVDDARAVIARGVKRRGCSTRGYGPIQGRSPQGNLIDLERNIALEDRECIPYSVPGDAPANWEELFDERDHGLMRQRQGWVCAGRRIHTRVSSQSSQLTRNRGFPDRRRG